MLLLIMGLYFLHINKSHLILHSLSFLLNIKGIMYYKRFTRCLTNLSVTSTKIKKYYMPENITKADSTINNHYLEAYKHSNH